MWEERAKELVFTQGASMNFDEVRTFFKTQDNEKIEKYFHEKIVFPLMLKLVLYGY